MTNATFGSYISSQRKLQGLSQKQLAAMILREDENSPISPQYLNDIERDRRQPTSDHIINQFSSALSIDSDYLFYLVGTFPTDIRNKSMNPSQVTDFMTAFRRGA